MIGNRLLIGGETTSPYAVSTRVRPAGPRTGTGLDAVDPVPDGRSGGQVPGGVRAGIGYGDLSPGIAFPLSMKVRKPRAADVGTTRTTMDPDGIAVWMRRFMFTVVSLSRACGPPRMSAAEAGHRRGLRR